MSAILALSAIQCINAKNNALYNMMNINNARMGMIAQPYNITGGIGFGSLEALSALDTKMEMDYFTNSVQYMMAKAMLEQIKKLQKEESERFSTFA